VIDETASSTAAWTIATLRVSRGGSNGARAVVWSAIRFHSTTALAPDGWAAAVAQGTSVATMASNGR
jgi:hypothetical protein